MSDNGHHGPASSPFVQMAAVRYLLSDPVAMASYWETAGYLILGVWGLAGGVSLLLAGMGFDPLNRSIGIHLIGVAFGAVSLLALGAIFHRRKWAPVQQRYVQLEVYLDSQSEVRARHLQKLSTVCSDEQERLRLSGLYDRGELSIADEQWGCGLIDQWQDENPATYPSQVQARAARPTRLCVCLPGARHVDCEVPDLDVRTPRNELRALQTASPSSSYRQSGRLKAVTLTCAGLFLFGFLGHASSSGSASPAATASTGQPTPGLAAATPDLPQPGAIDGVAAPTPAATPSSTVEASPEPTSQLATETFTVALTNDDPAAAATLQVRALQLTEDDTGAFTATGTVVDPLPQPVDAVLTITVLDGQAQVAQVTADAGCVPAHGTGPITWDSLQADPQLPATDTGYVNWDSAQIDDSASTVGCGSSAGH